MYDMSTLLNLLSVLYIYVHLCIMERGINVQQMCKSCYLFGTWIFFHEVKLNYVKLLSFNKPIY